MLVSAVIDAAQTLIDSVYDSVVWIKYINMALDDLGPIAKVLRRKDNITVPLINGSGTIDIANDADLLQAHEILYVYANGNVLTRLSNADMVMAGWKLRDGAIVVQKLPGESAACAVDYYRQLVHVNSVSDDIQAVTGLPEQYHRLVVLYCAYKTQQQEEFADRAEFYNEYLIGKNAMALERVWNMEPHNKKLVRGQRLGIKN